MAEQAMEKLFNSSTQSENGGLETTPPLQDLDSHSSKQHLFISMAEQAMEKPFNSSIQSEPENGGLEKTAPLQDQKIDENTQESGNDLRKTCTPDRLKVPKAFKFPERYRSPTDAMMSPVTKGLLARNRKAGGSLLPPSINQTKIHELRVQDIGLSQN